MKKYILGLAICISMAACSNSEDSKSASEQTNEDNLSTTTQQSNADTNSTKIGTGSNTVSTGNGEALIKASDCMTCHTNETQIVGPAYNAVAEKYPETETNINLLAGKIINGGSGVWGEIPMTPHPDVTEADAKEMVKYILALK